MLEKSNHSRIWLRAEVIRARSHLLWAYQLLVVTL